MKRGVCVCAALLGLSAGAAFGGTPIAVSPGEADRSTRIETRCPTFSWGAASDARGYELAVFEVDGSAGELSRERLVESAPLALFAEIPAAALAWTPASERCLVRGQRYAWLVRATDGAWSDARLFEVRDAPSVDEVEMALDTLRRYLDDVPGARDSEAQGDGLAAIAAAITSQASGSSPAADETKAAERAGVDPEIGVRGSTASTVDQSIGVHGEATAATGIADGVRGTSASVNGTGVRGTSSALSGITAGVWGGASSPDGYGAFFFNLGLGDPGGTGLYSSGALNASPDLILAGNFFWPEADQDDGRIHSDPLYPSSDLVWQSNDDVRVELDSDGDGEDSDFTVVDKDGQTVLNVDSSGITFIEGNLFITGEPQGGLVSVEEVEDLIDLAIEEHLAQDHPKLVFVTSLTYDGDLGGLSGADNKCQTLALNAGLIGNFKAWISGSSAGEEARDRMSRADVAYRRVDFVKIADSWADLIDGSLDAPINVDQNGNTVGSFLTAYTNTDSDGSIHETGRECGLNPGNEWNTDDQFESGGFGSVNSTGSSWSWTNNNACDNLRRLYCFEQ